MDDSGEIFPSALFASRHCACLGGRQMATFWKCCHQSDPCVVLRQEAVIWILALFWPYSGYRHITGLLLLFSVTVCDFMHSEAPQKRGCEVLAIFCPGPTGVWVLVWQCQPDFQTTNSNLIEGKCTIQSSSCNMIYWQRFVAHCFTIKNQILITS